MVTIDISFRAFNKIEDRRWTLSSWHALAIPIRYQYLPRLLLLTRIRLGKEKASRPFKSAQKNISMEMKCCWSELHLPQALSERRDLAFPCQGGSMVVLQMCPQIVAKTFVVHFLLYMMKPSIC